MSRVWWDDPEEGDNFYRWKNGSCEIIEPYEAVSYLNDLQKDSERLAYVIDRRDFLWDLWDASTDEVIQAIDEAMKQ